MLLSHLSLFIDYGKDTPLEPFYGGYIQEY